MNDFTKKLKLLFVPFLLITLCVGGGYTLLHWLLLIKFHVFPINETTVNLLVPMALPWIPLLVWLRPRIKLLNLKRKKSDLPSLYVLIAGFAMIFPIAIAQTYLQTASGKLTALDDISQIEKHGATKYYALKKFYIDKEHISIQRAVYATGKYNQNLNMDLYVALPILAAEKDTLSEKCLAWYGIKYHKRISNRLGKEEKEARFRDFAQASQEDFNTKDVDQFVYLDRIGDTKDHKRYTLAIAKNNRFSGNSTTVLIPVNEPFAKHNGNNLAWLCISFSIGVIVWLIMIAIPRFNETQPENSEEEFLKNLKLKDTILGFLIPCKELFITVIIIDANILIFLIMVFSGLGFLSFSPTDLLLWGANYRPITTNGEWWRLLTCIFLHGGIMHLFANIYGLLFVGIFLEPRLGRQKYAAVYLVTGVLASLASLWWHEATASVGASGAIFGLYGALLALIQQKVFPKDFSKAFQASILIFVGFNLLHGLSGGIDNAAHVGGLASGFIMGLILAPQLKRAAEYQKFVEEAQRQKKAYQTPEEK